MREGSEDAGDDAPPPEVRLAEAIRVLLRSLTVRSQDRSGDGRFDLSGTEMQLLGRLWDRPGSMGREVSAFLGLTPTTVQSILDRLVRRGLVSRAPHPEDGRAVALTLTSDGAALIERIRLGDVANCAAMLAALPERRRVAFVRDMAEIARRIERETP